MTPATSFKDLIVWQKAHEFVLSVYSYSRKFPREEIYVLIAANISEGFAKRGKSDKIRILNIAQGSLEECRYYIMLSNDLGYGENEDLRLLSEEVSKLLNAYINA